MHVDYPKTTTLARRVRRSLCLFAMASAIVCTGCSKSAAPPGRPAPPFAMPPAGDSTDTVLRIGDKIPEMQTVDLDGNAVAFDETMLGQRCTLIVFWSTWCGFCMQELPHEVELAKRYEPAGLRVVGINADATAEIATAAAQEHGVPWLNLFEGPDKSISTRLGIHGWPTLILLGPDGTVVMTSPQLRAEAVETLPDGSVRTVRGLDWALEELLGGK